MPGKLGDRSKKMKVSLPSDTEIVLTRVFDAPRHLVFEAMTKPEHVKRWWCSIEGYTMPICEIDLRVGGRWRYVMVGSAGEEVAFNGVYKEIRGPERLVYTEIFAPFPGNGAMVTVTLDERDGKTHYKSHSKVETKEVRDAIIASGMEEGADLALDYLEGVARSLA